MNHTCGGCPATWTGQGMCHCSSCHRTFSVLKWFDAHRQGGKCVDPLELKHKSGKHKGEHMVRLNERGVFVGAIQAPRFWEEEA